MKRQLLILFITFFLSGQVHAQIGELVEIRNLSGESNEHAAIKINQLLDANELDISIEKGYRSIALFINAKSCFSPFEKIKYFRAGMKLLESAIVEDITSLELRYLRFCVQTNIPFYLYYSSNIEEDKRLMVQNWNKITDADLKQRIRNYMMRSKYCSESEKSSFNNG